MNRHTLLGLSVSILLGGALLAGCKSDENEMTAEPATMAASSGAVDYAEIEADGRIFVVGTPAAAEQARKGKLPGKSVTRIGAGPNGQTVVFQADDDLDKKLIPEYEKRHN